MAANTFMLMWKHIGHTTLTLKEDTVTPKDAVVVKHPSKELGPDAETTLTWTTDEFTLGTVVWETPDKQNKLGKGMLFGVRFGRNIPGFGHRVGDPENYYEYMVHRVGTEEPPWIRPEHLVDKDFSFNVYTGDHEFAFKVTLQPQLVGVPEKTTLHVEVKDLFIDD